MRLFKAEVVLALVLLLLMLALATTNLSARAPSPRLHLNRATFDPLSQAQPPLPAGLAAPARGPYAIIQLHGPITLADRQALLSTGLTVLEYLPEYAYLVQGTENQLRAAEDLPQVRARVPFVLADKIAPGLQTVLQKGEIDMGVVNAIGWPSDRGQLARDLTALPFSLHAPITRTQLLHVANLRSVRWLEPAGKPFIVNDLARSVMGVNTAWQGAPLYGNGQIIGITDTGLDTGDLSTLSSDFAGRVVATEVLSATGNWADEHGHGTHVAGSAAGAGVLSGAITATHSYDTSFAGIAPESQLSIQAFEIVDPLTGQIAGIPNDYYQLFDLMYATGARLHSNSWGDTTGPTATPSELGGYVYGTQRTDQFVWEHPDMTVIAAAGNRGVDSQIISLFGIPFCSGGGNGVVDPDSLLSPGTAKNVITVGATETTRNTGPSGALTWFELSSGNPLCFYTDPIMSDPIANSLDGMAGFSSRGPADDGRVKPDIVAPGVNIVSSRSHDVNAGILWGEYDADYSYSGGTSMATPLVAGVSALVREWLQTQGAASPSAALVKATLLNTTTDIAPGQYPLAYQEIPYARPNNVSGWGRADTTFMDPPDGYAIWFDDHVAGLNTNDQVQYTHTVTRPLEVLTSTQPLRVMLAWTDPPASLSASAQLVNDLDLLVQGPGPSTYYGNDVIGGDRVNNVEGVFVGTPAAGHYTVTISAHNIPFPITGTQPYALVTAGPLTETAPSAPALFSFPINPGEPTPKYNDFGVALDSGITSASGFVYAITSTTNITPLRIMKLDPDTGFDYYIPAGGTGSIDFLVQVGDGLVIQAQGADSDTFTLTGTVPVQGAVQFDLKGSATNCKYNYITIPLDYDIVSKPMASDLAADIGDVGRVMRLDPDVGFDFYLPAGGTGSIDFPVLLGYPYVICMEADKVWP